LLADQARVAFADDCVKTVQRETQSRGVRGVVSNASLEDCMRTGYGQAIATGIVATLAGGAIAAAAGQALSAAAEGATDTGDEGEQEATETVPTDATRGGEAGGGGGDGGGGGEGGEGGDTGRGGPGDPYEELRGTRVGPPKRPRYGPPPKGGEGSAAGEDEDRVPITERFGRDDMPNGDIDDQESSDADRGERPKRDALTDDFGPNPGSELDLSHDRLPAEFGHGRPESELDLEPSTPRLTPEEQEAIRKRFRDLIQQASDADDPNTAFVLQRMMRNIPRDDAGLPRADLDKVSRIVKNMVAQPPGALDEIKNQVGDFVEGVTKDKDALFDAALASSDSASDSIHEFATDSSVRDRFWDGVVSTTDAAGDALSRKAHEIAAGTRRLLNDLADPQMRDEFIKSTMQEGKDLGRDLTNLQILGDTISQSASDLMDGDKVADAFSRGVPGGELLLEATDQHLPVTERLKKGLLGASELAMAADTVEGGLELGKGLTDRLPGAGAEGGEAVAAGAESSLGDGAAAGESDAVAEGGSTVRKTAADQEEATRKAAEKIRIDKARYTEANLSQEEMDNALGGMPERNQKHVQMVADKHGVEIQVRPTNPESRALLENGTGYPKPECIKMKTIDANDIALGAPADGAGKVGYFEPKLPEGYSSIEELQQANPKLSERFTQRQQEFVDRQEEVQRLMGGDGLKAGERQVVVRDGVVYDVETGKPFCGDHDLFDVRGVGGEELPKSVRDAIVKELKDGPAKVQHGDHMSWDYGGYSKDVPAEGMKAPFAKAEGIDEKILKGHAPPAYKPDGTLASGGEPLVTFRGSEQAGPLAGTSVQDRLEGSYYTGSGRPVRVSLEEKIVMKQEGITIEDLEKLSPSEVSEKLHRGGH
jgi:hypothetical protein